MTKTDKKQKRFSFYWLCGKIGDILFIPIILISIFSSISMLVQKKQNKPTSFFGYSLVNIMSGSMTSAGFIKGDTVITKKTSVDEIKLGEVIAFYNYRDSLDNTTSKKLVVKYNYSNGTKELDTSEENIVFGVELGPLQKVEREGEKTVQDAQKAKASVYFHQVIGIYFDDYGNVFYQTKGTNNANADNYIRSEFVVGEYVETPRILRDVISFCASAKGMIILVCIPLSILVLLQCFSLIKQIEIISIEKQIIAGKKRFNDEEVQKNFNGNYMETYNKVYLYFLTSDIEKEQVKNFMWGELLSDEQISKKDQNLINIMKEANEKLNTSKKEYWAVWINGTKGYTKKRIKKYYEEEAIYEVFASKLQKNATQQNTLPKINNSVKIQNGKEEATTAINGKNQYKDNNNIQNQPANEKQEKEVTLTKAAEKLNSKEENKKVENDKEENKKQNIQRKNKEEIVNKTQPTKNVSKVNDSLEKSTKDIETIKTKQDKATKNIELIDKQEKVQKIGEPSAKPEQKPHPNIIKQKTNNIVSDAKLEENIAQKELAKDNNTNINQEKIRLNAQPKAAKQPIMQKTAVKEQLPLNVGVNKTETNKAKRSLKKLPVKEQAEDNIKLNLATKAPINVTEQSIQPKMSKIKKRPAVRKRMPSRK